MNKRRKKTRGNTEGERGKVKHISISINGTYDTSGSHKRQR